MTVVNGVNLLPASGEWVYDTVAHRTQQVTQAAPVVQNLNYALGGTRADYSFAIDQLQAQFPACTTVSLIVAWFGSSTDVTQCKIYPSTIYIGGSSDALVNGAWVPDPWRCSGLTQASAGLIPLSQSGGSFVYGGTPADPSIVRCIRDLKSRGLRVVFYPFLLMDCPGYPWRGRIGFTGADISAAATSAVAGFLGSAAPSQFSRDTTNLTVGYAGAPTDYTYRRMILHYANLCVVAGGVDLFLIGSELRGLECIRGPAWTPAGTLDANGHAVWDYPFVAGLQQLAGDVRGVFDGAGLTKDQINLHNLVTYFADWSVWMGVQHPGLGLGYLDGQWPHLDSLYASPAIDLVSFDNYLPLSDWTSGDGGLDAQYWQAPAPSSSLAAWPPSAATMSGLGLTGAPTLHSKAYLKANVEGGEKYSWFYDDSTNGNRGPDPNGADQQVSRPEGDRLAQARTPYLPGQQLLANKMLRWWWLNPHQATYDTGDGQGAIPRGAPTPWVPQSKSITFAEYGFSTTDRCTNQPNVFFDPKSTESFTPYWSAWRQIEGGGCAPVRDDTLAQLALQAVYEYWVTDGNNAASSAGLPMIEPTFMSAWNWDARPFPAFPILGGIWGDAGNWPAGTWIGGKGPFVAPGIADAPPLPPSIHPTFPTLPGQAWSARYRPVWTTQAAAHVSGRESRAMRRASARWEIELSFDLLRMDGAAELQALAAFFETASGEATPFLVGVPVELGQGPALLCRFADDATDLEEFMTRLWQTQSLVLVSVPG